MSLKIQKSENKKNKYNKFIFIGFIFLLLSLPAYILLPQQAFFINAVCIDGCGYANVGLNVYAMCTAEAFILIGLLIIGLSLIIKLKVK
jgi:hypothetical protein